MFFHEYLKNKLSAKTNEASSFSRQLDLALSDANLKEHQIKDKFTIKVSITGFSQFRKLHIFNRRICFSKGANFAG